MVAFGPEEIERYKRQLVLKEIGGEGQQRLGKARVLVIGAGGLGAPLLLYLAGAGVGTIGIIDDDVVSLDNLHRQVIYKGEDIGLRKVAQAKAQLTKLNPHITIETFNARIDWQNAIDVISAFDIVADGSDNFATRYLVSDACHLAKRPLVFAAVGPMDGHITTFKSYLNDESGNPNPTYRCLFPEAPEGAAVFNCSDVGVMGSVVGTLGTLQATEIIKDIVGVGQSLVGRLLLFDALRMSFTEIKYAWDSDNPLNGHTARISDLSDHRDGAALVAGPG